MMSLNIFHYNELQVKLVYTATDTQSRSLWMCARAGMTEWVKIAAKTCTELHLCPNTPRFGQLWGGGQLHGANPSGQTLNTSALPLLLLHNSKPHVKSVKSRWEQTLGPGLGSIHLVHWFNFPYDVIFFNIATLVHTWNNHLNSVCRMYWEQTLINCVPFWLIVLTL